MGALLTEMVEKVDCGEQFVYWQVTRGTAMRNHAYPDPDKVPANLWIVLTPCSVQDTYKKINLITTEDTRFLHCNIKTLNLLPSCMGPPSARRWPGAMSPCSIGAILSPSARTPMCLLFRTACLRPIPPIIIFCRVLPGAHLIKMCKKLGYAVDETPFTVAEMMAGG